MSAARTCACGDQWCPGSANADATTARVEAIALVSNMTSAYRPGGSP